MEFLQQFINLTIMGLCVVIGYVWTTTVPENSPSRRYIPLTMCVLGSVLAVAVLRPVTLEVVLTGAVSGLASTGLHEAFKQLILKPKWIAQQTGTETTTKQPEKADDEKAEPEKDESEVKDDGDVANRA